jgi:2-C-methyl-D-erythritol 2,4-cyclodiphosphate synthase
MRVGIGHDTHRLAEGRPLVLGGVTIAHTHGLVGHSDADAVLHAIADALLGAAALGDIGDIFPDTDPQYRGADSANLLGEVVRRVRAAGWRTTNVDLIIHAERPKLAPHKLAMRNRIAELLQIPPDRVSVKAKTGELVGPIGRGEAITCEAVVLIEQRRTQEG